MSTIEDVGTRPSFFEIYLLENTETMFKPAFRHFFNIMLERYESTSIAPFLQRHFDDIYTFVYGAVQMNSLVSESATVAERLYGFKRESCDEARGDQQSIDARQQMFSIAYIVILPRIFGMLKDSLIVARRDIQARRTAETLQTDNEPPSSNSSSLGKKLLTAFVFCIRYMTQRLQAMKDTGIVLLADHWDKLETVYNYILVMFKVLYLFNKSDYHHPLFALLKMRLMRSNRRGGRIQSVSSSSTRQGTFTDTSPTTPSTAIASPTLLLTIALLLLKTAHWATTNDDSSHNIRLYLARPIPPPPFPRPSKIGRGGLIPPKDTSLCPICRQVRRNSVAASSGYVFCYTCLMRHVREHKTCPVTMLMCAEGDIIRLYETDDHDS